MPKFEDVKCPFCKNPLVHIKKDGSGLFNATCDNCGSNGPFAQTESTALNRWKKALNK